MPMSADPAIEYALVDAEHPWPGLAAFKEQEAQFFKGRTQDITKLHRLVNRERLTVLCGVSGLGKSSLLQAGLFPLLRRDPMLPVIIRLNFADDALPLRRQVYAALDRQADTHAVEAPVRMESETLWEYFHRKQSEFWDARNRIALPLLCFDQFEEIFTLGRETPNRRRATDNFITELADLIEGRCPETVKRRLDENPELSEDFDFSRHRFKLILSLREDYLANLEELRPLMPSIMHNRMRLRPMNGKQALAVVDQTHGRLLAAETAESIVRLVAGEQGGQAPSELEDLRIEPALLSLLCRELNERRIQNRAGRIEARLVDSSRESILEQFYRRCLHDQAPALRRFIEDRLLTVSGYRNSEAYDNALETPGITRDALDALVQGRLLILRQEQQGGVKRIELIHDVLAGVVRKSREQRQMLEKQRLDEQARAEAEQRERQAKRWAMVFVSLAAVFLLTAAWGWWNWWDAKQSRISAEQARNITQSGKLAAQAALLADTAADDRIVERAAALALESWRIQPNAEAAATAHALLRMLPNYRIGHERPIYAIGIGPDGGLLATGDEGGQLRVFNRQTGEEIFSMAHDGWINSIAFSPDGRFMATGCSDRQVRIIDAVNRRTVFRLSLDGEVNTVGFSPDGRFLAAAGKDGTARLIDVSAGRELWQFRHGGEVSNIAFSPGGRSLASASRDKTARLIDISSGKELLRLKHGAGVTHIAFNADGRLLATASLDNLASIIDAETGKALTRIKHNEAVASLAFSADGRWLATGSDDNTAKITEVAGGMEAARFSGADDVYSVRFSPDSHLLAIAGLDGSVRLLETAAWREIAGLMHGGAVWNVVFGPDSRTLATVGMDRQLRLFETGQYPDDIRIRRTDSIMGLAFYPRGGLLAAASQDKTATVYDVATGRQLMAFRHHDSVYAVAFSRDGRWLATASKDNTAKLIDMAAGREIASVRHSGEVRGIAFSPDGRWLATASLDKTVLVMDTASGKVTNKIDHADEVRFVAFSFDGQLLAIAGKDGTVSLLDTQAWQPVQTLKFSAPVAQLAFSPDNRILAIAGEDKRARLFDWRTGRETAEFAHAGSVLNVAFSPDGKLLATGSLDNAVRLIELATGKLVSLIKHGGEVRSIAFSAKGDFLATAGADGISRIIETASGLEIDRIGHGAEVWGVAFSPDDPPLLASALSDGRVRLHDADPQMAFDALCRKAGRNLNPDEWQDYLGGSLPRRTCAAWRTANALPAAP